MLGSYHFSGNISSNLNLFYSFSFIYTVRPEKFALLTISISFIVSVSFILTGLKHLLGYDFSFNNLFLPFSCLVNLSRKKTFFILLYPPMTSCHGQVVLLLFFCFSTGYQLKIVFVPLCSSLLSLSSQCSLLFYLIDA